LSTNTKGDKFLTSADAMLIYTSHPQQYVLQCTIRI